MERDDTWEGIGDPSDFRELASQAMVMLQDAQLGIQQMGRISGINNLEDFDIERHTACNLAVTARIRAGLGYALAHVAQMEQTLQAMRWKHYAKMEDAQKGNNAK